MKHTRFSYFCLKVVCDSAWCPERYMNKGTIARCVCVMWTLHTLYGVEWNWNASASIAKIAQPMSVVQKVGVCAVLDLESCLLFFVFVLHHFFSSVAWAWVTHILDAFIRTAPEICIFFFGCHYRLNDWRYLWLWTNGHISDDRLYAFPPQRRWLHTRLDRRELGKWRESLYNAHSILSISSSALQPITQL